MYNLKKPEIEHFNFQYKVEKKDLIENFDSGSTRDEDHEHKVPKQEGASITYQFKCYKKARQVD